MGWLLFSHASTYRATHLGLFFWSPDSTELMGNPVRVSAPLASVFSMFSATNSAADRTFSVPGQGCTGVSDWSANDRLALTCPIPNTIASNAVVTVSALDGTDIGGVVTNGCTIPVTLPCPAGASSARFSPNGSQLVMSAYGWASLSPLTLTARTVVAPDSPNATLTPITNDATNVAAAPFGWE